MDRDGRSRDARRGPRKGRGRGLNAAQVRALAEIFLRIADEMEVEADDAASDMRRQIAGIVGRYDA